MTTDLKGGKIFRPPRATNPNLRPLVKQNSPEVREYEIPAKVEVVPHSKEPKAQSEDTGRQ